MRRSLPLRSIRWLTALLVLTLTGIILAANYGLGQRLFRLVYVVPWGDKVGHMILMGLLSFMVNLSLRGRTWPLLSLDLLAGSLIVALIVTLEECSQQFLGSRTFSLADLAADYVGIASFGRLASRLTRRENQARKEMAHHALSRER